jgi:hypothetical protein
MSGDATPDRMRHLLARARWDANGVRDDVRGFVIEHLGDPDPAGAAGLPMPGPRSLPRWQR